VPLQYAIGKYYDDVKDFERAFLHYRQANELTKLCRAKYDQRRQTQAVDSLLAYFEQDWENREKIDANRSARPVLIVGMPRSGTSLAEQILASHPAVFGAGELPFWAAALDNRDVSALKTDQGDKMLCDLADDYLQFLESLESDALRVVDKMPGNFMFLGFIHAVLPCARIIHMRRNPIDTCLSIYFQHFAASVGYALDLEDCAQYYREYFRVMEHWRTVLPAEALLDVPYEGLVEDQEGWSRKMLEFIGLDWDSRCLDFHKAARTVSTASNWQVRQAISKSSVGRWRNYENFVEPLLSLVNLDR